MKKAITILSLGLFTLGYSQSDYYNDYRRSITDVNWQTVAANLLLSPQQKSDLFALNNQYSDYNSWNPRTEIIQINGELTVTGPSRELWDQLNMKNSKINITKVRIL